jgi:hypothetical protein
MEFLVYISVDIDVINSSLTFDTLHIMPLILGCITLRFLRDVLEMIGVLLMCLM